MLLELLTAALFVRFCATEFAFRLLFASVLFLMFLFPFERATVLLFLVPLSLRATLLSLR